MEGPGLTTKVQKRRTREARWRIKYPVLLISSTGSVLWKEPRAPTMRAENGLDYTYEEFVYYYGEEVAEVEWDRLALARQLKLAEGTLTLTRLAPSRGWGVSPTEAIAT